MLQLGYVCLISAYVGPLWAMSAPYWAHVGPFCCILWFAFAFVEPFLRVFCGLCWALLGKSWDHIRVILGHFDYVGTFWAMLAPYWAHVGPFWAIFGSVAFVLDLGISMSLNFRPCKAFAKNT